jgi:hypothetical protein
MSSPVQFKHDQIDHVSVKDDEISLTTHSCGCCSEHYSTHPAAAWNEFDLPVDELCKYLEAEQDRLAAIQEYVERCSNLEINTIKYRD